MDRKKLGQALVSEKKMSQENLKHALAMHDKIGGDFAPLLVKLGYVSDEDLTNTVAKLEGISTIDVSSLIIPKGLMVSIPRDVIEKHNVLPIRKKRGNISLAMANINDLEAIEEIQFLTGCRIEPILASRDAIRRAIIQFYYEQETQEDVPEEEEIESEDFLEEVDIALVNRAVVELLIEKQIISAQELQEKIKSYEE